ncbi:MAG: TIGR01777 family oxidoreductase [Aquiluna sp.]
MKVLVSGSSGLIGTELIKQLEASGHQPIRLVRRAPKNPNELQWSPDQGVIPAEVMEQVDAVVNLNGATTSKIPWTPGYVKKLISSRIDSTRLLVEAINNSKKPPKVFVSGSAEGFYGNGGDKLLTEDSPLGTGFMAELSNDWEQEAKKAKIRTILLRTTLAMSKNAIALKLIKLMISLLFVKSLGSGKQWWAWITVEDHARAIVHLIENEKAEGPYNLTAPGPATCEEIFAALGKELRRPNLIRIPAWAMRLTAGAAADQILLTSHRMSADKLLATGFQFNHPTLKQAASYTVR